MNIHRYIKPALLGHAFLCVVALLGATVAPVNAGEAASGQGTATLSDGQVPATPNAQVPATPNAQVPETADGQVPATPSDGQTTGAPSGAATVAPLQGHAEFEGPIDTPPVRLSAGSATSGSAPPKTYRGWLEQTYPEFSLHTSVMDADRLVVVSDKYDQAERTLDSLGLRYRIMSKKELDSYDLSNAQVLIIDCGPRELSWGAGLKIREFVIKGGYLFTTDWMLDRLDQKIFPGLISWSGAMNKQRMYDAAIVGKHPELFRHAVTNSSWKMDVHCHLIRVLNKEKVQVLAVSKDLASEDPDGQGILAVVFPYGRGYVMHMTAHFDRSQSVKGYDLPDAAPAIGISLRQALAINYVVAGLSGKKL